MTQEDRFEAARVFAEVWDFPVLETRTYPGHAYAYYIDEQGRTGLVDLLPPAQPHLVQAFDTTDMDTPRMDFGLNGHVGRNGQAGVAQ
jgi:hypothetical protein